MTASASARDIGIRLLREGSTTESMDFLLQAMAEDPSDVDVYMYLSLAYARQDEFDRVVEILEQALDVAPTNPKIHYNLGVAYQRSHNLTEAKNEYLRALGLDPTYAIAKEALDSLTDVPSDQTGMGQQEAS